MPSAPLDVRSYNNSPVQYLSGGARETKIKLLRAKWSIEDYRLALGLERV